ncbi:MAG: hypothetical protein MZV65_16700 [Chromatiales bacterium]|nr:hypothetical protein [Chromatiales bacterium]
MLQHILCGSRVAHYLKIMFRDKVGSFATANDCEQYLRDWLHRYTTGREDLEWEDQARYPLRAADVSVREHPAKPGKYVCEIRLRPHYQLDHMVSENSARDRAPAPRGSNMARVDKSKKLRPSILDRLLDDEPHNQAEHDPGQHQLIKQLRSSVRRDLESLLNTRYHVTTTG